MAKIKKIKEVFRLLVGIYYRIYYMQQAPITSSLHRLPMLQRQFLCTSVFHFHKTLSNSYTTIQQPTISLPLTKGVAGGRVLDPPRGKSMDTVALPARCLNAMSFMDLVETCP